MVREAPATVLIVEDDAGVARLQQRRLERAGYRVLTVGTADAARACTATQDVSLIVLDYRLPGEMTGLDLFRELKDGGLEIPVILVTGFSDEAVIIQALRAGVQDFVTKSTEYLDYLPEAVECALRQAEMRDALRRSEERFQLFIDHSPAVAFLKDESGRYIYANAPLRCWFQAHGWEWLGRTDEELWPPETALQLRDNDRRVLEEGTILETIEEVPGPDGSVQFWSVCKFPVRDPSGRLFIGGQAVDITERRRAELALAEKEEQLRQAQKLEALGQLAGGVAHEFNNLLQAVFGYASFALDCLSPEDPAYEEVRQIELAAERAAVLTRQMLSFGRRQVLHRADLNVNDVVTDLLKMLRPLIGSDIQLQTELADLSRVHADAGLLQQMLLNLCLNARDAMPSGGRLTISSSEATITAADCDLDPTLKPGRFVVLSVSDTGCGMSPELKNRIFEPFFTTKELGKGTGLGLAVVYGIVQQHGGLIRVASELGTGTTFHVYLPALASGAVERETGQPSAASQAKPTILFVDDDPVVREFVSGTLQQAGYNVLTAVDGEAAVCHFEEQAGTVALVILDIIMPRLDGRKTWQRIMEITPDVDVVFCSGCDPNSEQADFVRQAGLPLLHKPLDGATVLRLVRERLDAAPMLGRAC